MVHAVCVCQGTGCPEGPEIIRCLQEELSAAGLQGQVKITPTGCPGLCEQGPIMTIRPEGLFYTRVKPQDVPEIVRSLGDGSLVERLLFHDPITGQMARRFEEVPFYQKQMRNVLRLCGQINPEEIQEYIAAGGYTGLRRALRMTPLEVIEEVREAGLRGRGGAGFPAGIKWSFCQKETSPIKYMICNGDEGDPGAFMDRSILEANPHAVIEGMTIAAYAIGASEGYFYIRAEYPLAIRNIRTALQQAEERGIIGDRVMGSSFSFRAHIKEGAGAFVCGEETALIASIEGKRGMPRPRPPFPAQKGLWGKPTVINNVETLANVPLIFTMGAEAYASVGTERSKGTKVFALTGKVRNTGLVEVPMGITLREVIFDIGGGIPDGKQFKAVQTGGPSGGCIPASHLDLPVDYESLAQAGAIMGSGGMVVMDETTCMVDVARFFLTFTQSESCGKCVPCRLGTKHMLDMLTDIAEGRGTEEQLALLQEMAESVRTGSLCALGQTAPNPVLTTLRYFRDEYEAHIKDQRCPAGVCRALVSYSILADKCTGCGACLRACPQGAIQGERRQPHTIDVEACIKCGACFEVCRFGAVAIGGRQEPAAHPVVATLEGSKE